MAKKLTTEHRIVLDVKTSEKTTTAHVCNLIDDVVTAGRDDSYPSLHSIKVKPFGRVVAPMLRKATKPQDELNELARDLLSDAQAIKEGMETVAASLTHKLKGSKNGQN